MDNNPRAELYCACLGCKTHHHIEADILSGQLLHEVQDWQYKHRFANCRVEFSSRKRTVPRGFAGSLLDRLYEKIGVGPWWLEHPEFSPNANIKVAYASSVALTYTSLNSLASDTNLLAGASSLAVDNTSNLYLDYSLSGFCKNNSSAPTVGKEIDVYIYHSFDDTPTYPDTIAGTDATKTVTTSNILSSAFAPFGQAIIAATGSQVNAFRGKSIASLFGGVLPKLWGVFIVHNSGLAFSSTGNTWTHIPLYVTSI